MTELNHIVLSESYVLGISIKPYCLEFSMDFVLEPEHPLYFLPPPNETECFRRGLIRVLDFERVTWRASNLKPSTDATGEEDYGCLDELVIEQTFMIFRGDWGEIEVAGGHMFVVLV